MRVIKKGREQIGWSRQKICTGDGNGGGGCGAVLVVEERDLFRTGKHPYDGSHEYFCTFKCISCGVLTDINDWPGNPQDLPASIGGEGQP